MITTAAELRADEVVAGLLERCRFPAPGSPVSCAVSGGADSSALAVLAVAAGLDVTAVHVDHGLRPGSGAEAGVVAELAGRFGMGFRAEQVVVEPGPNLEARARAARHAVLPVGAMLGHTADDQAETVLLNLVRGAGLDGLAGMRPDERRPVLALRRAETHHLCARIDIDVVDDPSNDDPAFRRNRIRHEVLPLLDDIAGRDVAAVLARQAPMLREVLDVLDDQIVVLGLDATDARSLAAAPPAVAAHAVRVWLRTFSPEGHPPDAASVRRVLEVAAGQRRATEVTGGHRVVRSAGVLRVEAPVDPDAIDHPATSPTGGRDHRAGRPDTSG